MDDYEAPPLSPLVQQKLGDLGMQLVTTPTNIKLVKDGEVMSSLKKSLFPSPGALQNGVVDMISTAVKTWGKNPSGLHDNLDMGAASDWAVEQIDATTMADAFHGKKKFSPGLIFHKPSAVEIKDGEGFLFSTGIKVAGGGAGPKLKTENETLEDSQENFVGDLNVHEGLADIALEGEDWGDQPKGSHGVGYPQKVPASVHAVAKVTLDEAEYLYQKVHGSGVGSTYFAVALSDELNMAVRIKGGKLSVRVEGPGLPKYSPALNLCGLVSQNNPQQTKFYASIHLEVHSDMEAHKAYGAILLGCGVPWSVCALTLVPILGQGN